MGVQVCFIMMRLWLALFLMGISSGLKYIEEREVTTSTGKMFTCFYTIQYTAKGVVSTKKSSVSCTPDKKGGSAMPVFDLPGVGPTSIKHTVKKGKDSVQDYSAYTGAINTVMPMNCSCRVPLSLDIMGSGSKPNTSKPQDNFEDILEDMCSDGGKPEKMQELMVVMNVTKDMIKNFMMASPEEKEEMIQELMMTLPEEKKEMLQKIIQMIESGGMKPPMGTGGNGPMGGGMIPPMGQGGSKPMGGGMKPPMGQGGSKPMGGGMKPGMDGKPEGSDCQQQLMEMICSGKEGMGGKPEMGGKPRPPMGGAKPGSMQQIEAGVLQMMMDMTGLSITDQGEAALNVDCDCMPMKQK